MRTTSSNSHSIPSQQRAYREDNLLTCFVEPFLYLASCQVFLLGLFWKKGTALAAKYTLICGHTLCIICLFLVNIGTIRIHFTIIAAILLAICILAYILLSLFANEAPKLNLENLVWSERTSLYTEPAIWYMQAKFIAALLVAITLIIVGIYW